MLWTKSHVLLWGLAPLIGYATSAAAVTNSTAGSVPGRIDDPASLVNLFIGTTNGGNVFPGE
jgi:hypothetical protein